MVTKAILMLALYSSNGQIQTCQHIEFNSMRSCLLYKSELLTIPLYKTWAHLNCVEVKE